MNYKAFYRTYRPTKFSEVKGQENIVRTLTNIIKMDKISHAYLFCGPRGTGKTSVAKIFANVINCFHSAKKEEACQMCLEHINNSLDIIEIDAASNNGVAEIRDLREKIKYFPTQYNYKIYIIDEVHMLSKGAFNALLKTLEEPPAHIIFIFATTDPDKLPLTILSRVQRYNFSRISKDVLIEQVENILKLENIKYDPKILDVVANLASGSLRDALSIIDQVNAYSNSDIKLKDINSVFALASYESQVDILNHLANKDIVNAIREFNKLFDEGLDINKFIESLIFLIKNTILYKKTSNENVVDFYDVTLLSKIKIDIDKSYVFLENLVSLIKDLKFNENPKQMVELAFIKICSFDKSLKEFDFKAVNQEYSNLDNSIAKETKKNTIDSTSKLNFENFDDKIKESKTKIITDDFALNSKEEKKQDSFLKTDSSELIKNATHNESFYFNNEVSQNVTTETKAPFFKQKDSNHTSSFNPNTSENYTSEISGFEEEQMEDNKILTQPEIINLFLLAEKEEMAKAKASFKKSLIEFVSIPEFEDFIFLLAEIKIIAAAHDFVFFATEKNFLVNDINSIKNTKNFKKYIIKTFGGLKHIFIINKISFIDAKELWSDLKKTNKFPNPKKLAPIKTEEIIETKNQSFIKKGNELFGNIFKRKKD